MAEQKESEFEVKDRRRFTEEGELRPEAEEAQLGEAPARASAAPPPPPPPRSELPGEVPQSAESQQAARTYAEAGRGSPPITFDRLIVSYAQTAMLQLGLLVEDPAHPPEPDLYGARDTIDILGMLEQKTRGNLTPEESRMLENTLYQLRMAWMEISRSKK